MKVCVRKLKMADNAKASGTTGLVWKIAMQKIVKGRPARQVCTVANFSGPAAAEACSGRIRSGDKLVAIFHPPLPCPAATSAAARI